MPNCRKCKVELKWKQPYIKGTSFDKNTTDMKGKPHKCGTTKSQYYVNPYEYDPYNGNVEAEARFKEGFAKAEAYCDICKSKYKLSYPCIHHLTDSYKDKKRREAYKKSGKKEAEVKSEQSEFEFA